MKHDSVVDITSSNTSIDVSGTLGEYDTIISVSNEVGGGLLQSTGENGMVTAVFLLERHNE